MNQIALIVHTCDRYQLLYKGFEYFFKKYLPYGDVPLSYYFLTEDADYHSDIFTNIKTGKGEWSDRLLKGLKKIPESYVLYFQEDMWLNQPLDADALGQVIAFALAQQVSLLKLSSNHVFHTRPTGKRINGLAVSVLDNARSGYLMSHQVSIWDKAFFMEQLKYKEHPWRNERKGTKRLKKLNPLIYHIDLFLENEEHAVNKNKSDAHMSHYYTISQNAQLNDRAHGFISAMRIDANPAIREYAEKLDMHLKNGLTHDGLSKPRKDDIFKKLKKLFKK